MFVFIKKVFFSRINNFIRLTNANYLLNAIPLNFILIKNQECKVRPEIINVNSNNPIFYPFSIKIKKCSGSCNNINNP